MVDRQSIIEKAKELGIHDLGFCRTRDFVEYEGVYQQRAQLDLLSTFEANMDIKKRIYPELTLPRAKSFIAIVEKYPLVRTPLTKDKLQGRISAAAISEDYHAIVMRKLNDLKTYIETLYTGNVLAFCDTSPFSDRTVAYLAGLGTISKNSFLMHPVFGTSVFIGYLITDLEMNAYNEPLDEDFCKECNLCLKACPVNAICRDVRQINAKKCISYLTQSKVLSDDEKCLMERQIYGCDFCQLVCPRNTKMDTVPKDALVSPTVDLEALLTLDNQKFEKTYKQTASGWRGKKTLQRNAIIALSRIHTKESVDLLRTQLSDPRKDIRETAVWALAQITID